MQTDVFHAIRNDPEEVSETRKEKEEKTAQRKKSARISRSSCC